MTMSGLTDFQTHQELIVFLIFLLFWLWKPEIFCIELFLFVLFELSDNLEFGKCAQLLYDTKNLLLWWVTRKKEEEEKETDSPDVV